MTDNLKLWEQLGKTDPNATKAFSRAGGFKGTAVKPMWTLKRLTEVFGPAGIGWGVNKPEFQTVHATEGEVLVYCTVSAWHDSKDNVLWGVGGDKVVVKNKNGLVTDDEAFKKAFTDAVGNAFKSIGVAADIHMGLFDDDKYVNAMREEFEAEAKHSALITDAQVTTLIGMFDNLNIPVATFLKVADISALCQLGTDQFDEAVAWINRRADKMRQQREAA